MAIHFEKLMARLKKIFIEPDPEEVESLSVHETAQEEIEEQPIVEETVEPEVVIEPEPDPICVKLAEFRACIDVATHLMEKTPVFLELTAVDYAIAKRALDFLGGVVYALQGSLKQVTDSVFYLTPYSTAKEVEVLKEIYDLICEQ